MTSTSILECRGAGEVLQQNFSSSLVFIADESELKEKAPKCIFLIVDRLFGRIDATLVPSHLAQLADECVVSIHLVRRGCCGEPGEGLLRARDFQWQVVHTEGLLDKTTLGSNEVP